MTLPRSFDAALLTTLPAKEETRLTFPIEKWQRGKRFRWPSGRRFEYNGGRGCSYLLGPIKTFTVIRNVRRRPTTARTSMRFTTRFSEIEQSLYLGTFSILLLSSFFAPSFSPGFFRSSFSPPSFASRFSSLRHLIIKRTREPAIYYHHPSIVHLNDSPLLFLFSLLFFLPLTALNSALSFCVSNYVCIYLSQVCDAIYAINRIKYLRRVERRLEQKVGIEQPEQKSNDHCQRKTLLASTFRTSSILTESVSVADTYVHKYVNKKVYNRFSMKEIIIKPPASTRLNKQKSCNHFTTLSLYQIFLSYCERH